MKHSNAEKWLHFARCRPKSWMRNDSLCTKGWVCTVAISFWITLTCVSSVPPLPRCWPRTHRGLRPGRPLGCRHEAEDCHALREIPEADLDRLRGSGTTPATFINNLVPNHNSLSISVSSNCLASFDVSSFVPLRGNPPQSTRVANDSAVTRKRRKLGWGWNPGCADPRTSGWPRALSPGQRASHSYF